MSKKTTTTCDFGTCGAKIPDNELTVTVNSPRERIMTVGGEVIAPTGDLHFHVGCWNEILKWIQYSAPKSGVSVVDE